MYQKHIWMSARLLPNRSDAAFRRFNLFQIIAWNYGLLYGRGVFRDLAEFVRLTTSWTGRNEWLLMQIAIGCGIWGGMWLRYLPDMPQNIIYTYSHPRWRHTYVRATRKLNTDHPRQIHTRVIWVLIMRKKRLQGCVLGHSEIFVRRKDIYWDFMRKLQILRR